MNDTGVPGIPSRLRLAAGALALLALAGCMSIPREHVAADRIDYGQVIGDSWKRQTLLNVVRLRYADAPVFLEVASIINSNSVVTKASAGAEIFSRVDPTMLALGADRTWSNTPTVTYQPLTGERFTRSLLRPVPLAAVVQLLQGGWPADLVMHTMVGSINGLRSGAPGAVGEAGFNEAVAALSRLQRAGGLEIRIESDRDGGTVVIVLPRGEADTRLKHDGSRLVELLGLEEGKGEYEVVYRLLPRNRSEVAIVSRSMLELMLRLGTGIELPGTQADQSRAIPVRPAAADPQSVGLARIRSGSEAPADAYAAVFYKGHWYWIDDADVASKRIFTFLLILFSLAETGPTPAAPVVTVPSR